MKLKVIRGMLWTGDGQILRFGDIFEAAEPFASDYIRGKIAVSMEGEPIPPAPVIVQEFVPLPGPSEPEPVYEPEPEPERTEKRSGRKSKSGR